MLGERIRAVRISRKLTQVEFAKILNVSKQSVSNWENDEVVPALQMIKQIAEKFSVSADYLLELNNRYILDIEGLSIEVIAHLQQIINDLKEETHIKKDFYD